MWVAISKIHFLAFLQDSEKLILQKWTETIVFQIVPYF